MLKLNDMELPPWLKIENLIGSLNFTGWFRGWFNRENKTQIDNVTNINKVVILFLSPDEKPKIIRTDEIYQKIEPKEQEKFEFTGEEKYLITKVNKAHVLCGRHGFNFEKNYKQALNHIRNKPSDDWYECASKDMVLVKENIDIFQAFKEIKDPEEVETFENYKKDINYLYSVIQKIKHSNNRGSVKEEFSSPYDKRFNKDVMTEERYEELFNNFQGSLIKLFREFKLKDE